MSLVGCNNQTPTKEEKSVSQKQLKEDYDLQERCGKRCDEVFTKGFGKEGITNDKGSQMMSNYTNHYNKKMNKCFMVIASTTYNPKTKDVVIMKNIFDVNENKDYGSVIKVGARPTTNGCLVLDKKCNSEEEWDSLIKPYMEE
jgi:hypothetical protein